METEIWKSHPEIVGIEVSNLGRVRTLDRVTSSEERTQFVKGHVFKQCSHCHGYLVVDIPADGKWVTKTVHRLVAQTFIPNQNNLPEVNHKNCIRNDNRVENLEWVTHEENIEYREKFGEKSGQPVLAINLNTLEVSQFRSQREAGRSLGILQPCISRVIKGQRKQTGGFWFTNDDEKSDDIIKRKLNDIKGESNGN